MQVVLLKSYLTIMIVVFATKGAFSDTFCHESRKLDSVCASYCYRVSKPLFQMAPKCYSKDAEIIKLKDQLTKLAKQNAVWEEKASQFENQMKLVSDMAEIKANVANLQSNRQVDSNNLKQVTDQINAYLSINNIQNSLKSGDAINKAQNQKINGLQTKQGSVQNKPDYKILESTEKNAQYLDNCGNSSGIQMIQVSGISEPFEVLCDNITMDFPWIVIQKRVSRDLDFNRNWQDYANGFGDVNDNYFMGLEKIYYLTKTQPYELYVHLESFKGQTGFARYSYFVLGSSRDQCRIQSLGIYTGNAGNAMSDILDKRFITPYDSNRGGWWESNNCNLNGRYSDFEISNTHGIWWKKFNEGRTLKTVKMLIRPART
ncbi:angiopoietin-related protein 7-like [Drosophila innubila]|uniref:angiopoietin-related protein 7-like n=1 Tax=Drosophila innubila TaxID=198719 RepID=UPI00148BCCB6|nr:angiopoietin-related protein 7-like [Drosophila innubila]